MRLPSFRQVNLGIVAISIVAMISALYFEHIVGLAPCPLCITQRVFIILAGVLALLAFIHNPKTWGLRVYSVLTIVAAASGGFFSGRQLWLQSLPKDQVPACGPSLDYIMDNFPIFDALQVLMRGDGNCAEVSWRLLGFSMPAWVLLIFVVVAVLAASQVVRTLGSKSADLNP